MQNFSAVKTNQDDSLVWFNKGKLLTQLGELETALDCFNYAIAIKEDFYEAWSEKGYVLEQLNRFSEADICFNMSLGAFCDAIDAIDWDEKDDCDFMIY